MKKTMMRLGLTVLAITSANIWARKFSEDEFKKYAQTLQDYTDKELRYIDYYLSDNKKPLNDYMSILKAADASNKKIEMLNELISFFDRAKLDSKEKARFEGYIKIYFGQRPIDEPAIVQNK